MSFLTAMHLTSMHFLSAEHQAGAHGARTSREGAEAKRLLKSNVPYVYFEVGDTSQICFPSINPVVISTLR